MLCRAPLFTEKNLDDINLMVRMNWVKLMHFRLEHLKVEGTEPIDVVREVVGITDMYRHLLDPLVLWRFQLRFNGAEQVRALIRPDLYEEYVRLARLTDASYNPGILTAQAQETLDRLESGRLELLKILEDAPAVDPQLANAPAPPSGTTPTTMN